MNIGAKTAHKMLIKLTTELQNFKSSTWHFNFGKELTNEISVSKHFLRDLFGLFVLKYCGILSIYFFGLYLNHLDFDSF